MSSEPGLDTSRIGYLVDVSHLARLRVVVVGLGSGGAVVVERLAMSGIGDWALFDPDTIEPVNLVKHPARRSDLGRPKVEWAEAWLRDRNPHAGIRGYQESVMAEGSAFATEVARSDVVICAVDNATARSFVNSTCVELGVPCVFGLVFRTGLGGEVYAYVPGETACHDCKMRISLQRGIDIENWLEMTPEEKQHVYGMGQADFVASGLGADIAVVAGLHAHYVLSLLGSRGSQFLTAPSFNWLTIGLRSEEGLFQSLYEVSRAVVRPQEECHLGCGRAGRRHAEARAEEAG